MSPGSVRQNGSTRQLLQFSAAYFFFYVLNGLFVKYFQAPAADGFPGQNATEYLVYGTFGSAVFVLAVILALGWPRLLWRQGQARIRQVPARKGPVRWVAPETYFIMASGVCAGVIIPTTTLMYSLPISVMVAMVIMRGGVIVLSRGVDALQIHQGILHKKVYAAENWAVFFALLGVGVHLASADAHDFDFLKSGPAVIILTAYLSAYGLRIYLMNYYKNTRPVIEAGDNRGYFVLEQLSATMTLLVAAVLAFYLGTEVSFPSGWAESFRASVLTPHSLWLWAALSGIAFGAIAFFSLFIFMFQGRTATFTGLVNRSTSLLAGTASTLLFAWFFGGTWPSAADWQAFGLIGVAIIFLSKAEQRRALELKAAATNEIAMNVLREVLPTQSVTRVKGV